MEYMTNGEKIVVFIMLLLVVVVFMLAAISESDEDINMNTSKNISNQSRTPINFTSIYNSIHERNVARRNNSDNKTSTTIYLSRSISPTGSDMIIIT